jgi:hypothetical protein
MNKIDIIKNEKKTIKLLMLNENQPPPLFIINKINEYIKKLK